MVNEMRGKYANPKKENKWELNSTPEPNISTPFRNCSRIGNSYIDKISQ